LAAYIMPGLEPRLAEKVGKPSGGRGFPVRAHHRQKEAVFQKPAQRIKAGQRILGGLKLGVFGGYRGGEDDGVHAQREVFRGMAAEDLGPLRGLPELSRGLEIRAGDLCAVLPKEAGQPRHPVPTDAHKMNPGEILHDRSFPKASRAWATRRAASGLAQALAAELSRRSLSSSAQRLATSSESRAGESSFSRKRRNPPRFAAYAALIS
jgi:hypothetical protein